MARTRNARPKTRRSVLPKKPSSKRPPRPKAASAAVMNNLLTHHVPDSLPYDLPIILQEKDNVTDNIPR